MVSLLCGEIPAKDDRVLSDVGDGKLCRLEAGKSPGVNVPFWCMKVPAGDERVLSGDVEDGSCASLDLENPSA